MWPEHREALGIVAQLTQLRRLRLSYPGKLGDTRFQLLSALSSLTSLEVAGAPQPTDDFQSTPLSLRTVAGDTMHCVLLLPSAVCGVTTLHITPLPPLPAGAYYNEQHPGGTWLTALVAAALPLRQLRLRNGTVVPGELLLLAS